MYYIDGWHKIHVLDTRPIEKENFTPMVHARLRPDRDVQILVNGIGGERGITVRKKQIVEDPAVEFKHQIGDRVTFVNRYGVNLGTKTITDRGALYDRPIYYIAPTDTPWCYVSEELLHPIE